jgi:peptidyl-dipeptidase A
MHGLIRRTLPALLLVAAACSRGGAGVDVPPPTPTPIPTPTADQAAAFVADTAERTLYDLGVRAGRAAWVQANFITPDTEILAAEANERYLAAQSSLAGRAAVYDGLDLPHDVARKLGILKTAITLPAPRDPARTAELSRLAASLESTYGSGAYCPPGGECLALGELENILATARDEAELREAWAGWRTTSPPMRGEYQRFVELANQGASQLGYADVGALWRSGYDMDPDAFAAELDRLWNQVRPLYESLHCYVGQKLGEHYGFEVAAPGRPLPAHLLGNMWAQQWGNIYDLVAPADATPGYDLTERLRARGYDAAQMVRTGESFFTSLGFEPLPETFWERSLFTRPADRDVVCHASAWNVDEVQDLRIKMCIEVDAEDFQTIHHELGHNYYQRAYNHLGYLYRNSANDGFHEALGDAVALSVTPAYLETIGLIDQEPPAAADIGLLLRDALDKVAFLPFGLLVDQWRWRVFSGQIQPTEYNRAWWDLRLDYQGIVPPMERTEEHFDPGAKYHVPANVPYTRYFLAHILQFQFHRALCQAADFQGPLHRCSIYGNREAGRRLDAMMQMGASRPWPDALEALTGSREMDATAIQDYFAPLAAWLDEQNRGRRCGW